MNVLVADDDEDIRFLVETMLRREGWEVTESVSGEATIALLGAGHEFDVLVLDQNMPPGSGLEVIAWLQSAGDTTPVLLFTGYVSTIDQAAVGRLGVTVLDKVAVKQLPGVVAELAGPATG